MFCCSYIPLFPKSSCLPNPIIPLYTARKKFYGFIDLFRLFMGHGSDLLKGVDP